MISLWWRKNLQLQHTVLFNWGVSRSLRKSKKQCCGGKLKLAKIVVFTWTKIATICYLITRYLLCKNKCKTCHGVDKIHPLFDQTVISREIDLKNQIDVNCYSHQSPNNTSKKASLTITFHNFLLLFILIHNFNFRNFLVQMQIHNL